MGSVKPFFDVFVWENGNLWENICGKDSRGSEMAKTRNNKAYAKKTVKNGQTMYWGYVEYYDSEGKRRQTTTKPVKKKSTAQAMAEQKLSEILAGEEKPGKTGKETIENLLEDWEQWLRDRPINGEGFKAATKASYVKKARQIRELHTKEEVLKTKWNDFNAETAKLWARDISSEAVDMGGDLSNTSCANLMAQIANIPNGFFYYLDDRRLLFSAAYDKEASDRITFCDSFIVKKPHVKKGARAGRWITEGEFLQLINLGCVTVRVTEKGTHSSVIRPTDFRNGALFSIMYYATLRVSEVVPLRWTNIFFDHGLIEIERAVTKDVLKEDKEIYRANPEYSSPKSRDGKRYVPMTKQLKETLEDYKNLCREDKGFREDQLLFFATDRNRILSKNAIDTALHKAMKTCYLSEIIGPFSLHDLRRSGAHYLGDVLELDEQAIMNFLGHKDGDLIREVYDRKSKIEVAVSAARALHEREFALKEKLEEAEANGNLQNYETGALYGHQITSGEEQFIQEIKHKELVKNRAVTKAKAKEKTARREKKKQ